MTYYSLICFECIWKLPGEWQSSSRADPLVQFTWVWESAAQQRREVLLLRYLFQKLDALWAFEQDKIRHHTLTIMIMLWSMWLQDTWYWEITCLQGDTKPNSFLQAITLEDSAVAEVEISSNCMQLPPARHRTPRVSWNLPWRPLKKVLDELTVLEVCGTWNTLKHMSMWQKWIAQSWWLPSWKKKQTLPYTRLLSQDSHPSIPIWGVQWSKAVGIWAASDVELTPWAFAKCRIVRP